MTKSQKRVTISKVPGIQLEEDQAMTDEYFVGQLCRKMGETAPYGIEWAEHPEGGLMAEINGVYLRIGGGQDSPIFLEISSGINTHIIREPRLPQAPARKVLNWLGRNSEQDANKQKLRTDLETLLNHALKQCLNRRQDPDHQEKVKQMLFGQIIGKL
ncbi:MAG: hypothetical protein Q8P76_02350 [bacterium]|nr:hypothetical protein [bacterium]